MLKVYYGTMIVKQPVEAIVAANSLKEVAEIHGTSVSYVRDYFTVTINEDLRSIALSHPGVIFIKRDVKSDWERR